MDDASLPTAPTPGDDELWLIQVPGDVSVKDLHGLRLKLTGEGAGADLAAFKAGGKKYRLVEEDATTVAGMFVLPPTKGRREEGRVRRGATAHQEGHACAKTEGRTGGGRQKIGGRRGGGEDAEGEEKETG